MVSGRWYEKGRKGEHTETDLLDYRFGQDAFIDRNELVQFGQIIYKFELFRELVAEREKLKRKLIRS